MRLAGPFCGRCLPRERRGRCAVGVVYCSDCALLRRDLARLADPARLRKWRP